MELFSGLDSFFDLQHRLCAGQTEVQQYAAAAAGDRLAAVFSERAVFDDRPAASDLPQKHLYRQRSGAEPVLV
ncbi:hypothetical protein D3C76_1373590 [compost metagenome]